ncbi:TetR/AcrR family transcriptional regulator [Nocardioides sp. QY071]|uniref:TetR/AcrR family transcriptional regulator n=1 Tax=Nocardioides sp. QY071 TaxID=3044187 RepID=UPI00249C1209|nr:TetR/AcrR family transcriptional regulator [Nocardioides sp. QY071]WGY00129.1 TetR/AcrR family transcriptional regulator [Nocardioides sp. QY071]
MTTSKRSYHHGDLRNALARAAADLAASGGPDAVTIRGAAREVGVTPTAAYRHFENQADLLEAARALAMDGMVAAMADYLAQVPTDGDPVARAVERLRSTGRGYIRFAIEEPGVFRTCFTGGLRDQGGKGGQDGMGDPAPYLLLGEMLDQLVAVGYLDPADRPDAEAGPWAAVHGLAMLLIDGPMSELGPPEQDIAIARTLDMVSRGLATGPQGCAHR